MPVLKTNERFGLWEIRRRMEHDEDMLMIWWLQNTEKLVLKTYQVVFMNETKTRAENEAGGQ